MDRQGSLQKPRRRRRYGVISTEKGKSHYMLLPRVVFYLPSSAPDRRWGLVPLGAEHERRGLIIKQVIRSDVAMMRAMSSMVRQRQQVGVKVEVEVDMGYGR